MIAGSGVVATTWMAGTVRTLPELTAGRAAGDDRSSSLTSARRSVDDNAFTEPRTDAAPRTVARQRASSRICDAGASAPGPGRRYRCRNGAARLRGGPRQAAQRSVGVPRQGPGRPGNRPGRRSEAHRRLPARRAARRDPRAVVRPRRGDRRERAGGAVLRAREPRGVLPAVAGHDAARRGQLHQPRHRQGARPVRAAPGAGHRQPAGGASGAGARGEAEPAQPGRAVELLREPEQEGDGGKDRPADRPRAGDRAHDPDPLPAHQEQPAVCRRSRRRQDGDRRRPGEAHRGRRRARGAGAFHHLRARHGRAAGGHALSRRLRGAAEGGGVRAGKPAGRDPVHRRDPHRDRRRRHIGRRDGRLEPAEAGAGVGQPALHRLDHLQGIPQLLREGPRAGPPLPEDRRERAEPRGQRQDPARPEDQLRTPPQGALHRRSDPRRGGAVREIHQRPQAARQGDRRDRRGGRLPHAAARAQAAEDGDAARRRGDRREDRAHSSQERVGRRQGDAAQSGARPEVDGVRPGQGDRGAVGGDQAGPCRPARAGEADRQLPVLRPDRRRQDRGGTPACRHHGHRADPLRHVGIHGAALRFRA